MFDRQKIADAIKTLEEANAIDEGVAVVHLLADYDAEVEGLKTALSTLHEGCCMGPEDANRLRAALATAAEEANVAAKSRHNLLKYATSPDGIDEHLPMSSPEWGVRDIIARLRGDRDHWADLYQVALEDTVLLKQALAAATQKQRERDAEIARTSFHSPHSITNCGEAIAAAILADSKPEGD
jgi:hypothetical protein